MSKTPDFCGGARRKSTRLAAYLPPLKRPYLYPALALLAVVVASATPASGQSVPSVRDTLLSAADLALPEAVVVASRNPVARQRLGHSYDVLTAAMLETLPVTTVAEAMQYLSGLDLRQRGPRGVQADLSIRGGTFDQSVVLINGVRMADPQTGHHTMNIPVPLENVARIEVLKGPGARIYGQNAFAGAVNIVTKVDDERAGTLRAEVGENGLAGFGVSLNLPLTRLRQTLSYQRDVAQGYRENTDYDLQTTFYQANLPTRRGQVGLLAGLSERAFGANGFYASASATQQYEEIQTSLVALTHAVETERGNFSQRLSWRRNQDEYVFVRANPSIYRNLHISQVYGYDGFYNLDNRLGQLGIGGEVQAVTLASNNLGDRSRGVANLVLEQTVELLGDRLRVTGGATLNYLTDAGARVLPGLDASYELSPGLSAYANTGLTYRVPTYTDLFYSDRFNEGNADLVAERAVAYELGLQYARHGIDATAAVWQRDAIDLIDYVRDSAADSVWQPRNITDATFRGVELQVALRNKLPWLPLARVSYNFIDASLDEGGDEGAISRYALDQLRHQFVAMGVVRLARPLTVTATLRYGDRVSEPPSGALPVDYTLVDLRADYRLKGLRFFAEASNLADVEYSQVNGVPLPGRWLRCGTTVRIK